MKEENNLLKDLNVGRENKQTRKVWVNRPEFGHFSKLFLFPNDTCIEKKKV